MRLAHASGEIPAAGSSGFLSDESRRSFRCSEDSPTLSAVRITSLSFQRELRRQGAAATAHGKIAQTAADRDVTASSFTTSQKKNFSVSLIGVWMLERPPQDANRNLKLGRLLLFVEVVTPTGAPPPVPKYLNPVYRRRTSPWNFSETSSRSHPSELVPLINSRLRSSEELDRRVLRQRPWNVSRFPFWK